MKYIMALDQGTTSSRCILFDKDTNICSQAQKEFEQIYPTPGWVEHDPMQLWHTTCDVMKEAMDQINASPEDICGIGITNQRETTIVWDKETGKPIYNAIVWQCRRTAQKIEELKEKGLESYIRETTGLVLDAYFSGTKIQWILDNVEGARAQAKQGKLLFGTVDTWLMWKLSKGSIYATDYTNASRTMLYDIKKLDWDDFLLKELKIPREMLPTVKPSSGIFGHTDEAITGKPIPIAGVAGDQQAALFGQCCFQEGEMKNTYGTGCFLLMNTGKKAVLSKHGLITTIAANTGEVQYALEGSVFVAGAAIQWLRDELKVIESAAQSQQYANEVTDTQGAYVVPAFTGLGAPYWDSYARGTIVGMTRGFNEKHLVRATLESLAYQVHDVIEVMEQESSIPLECLRVDGGASANDFIMQFQADILQAKVLRPKCIETTALGVAYLAGLAVSYWSSKEEIKENWALSRAFEPDMDKEQKNHLIKGWKKAVRCAQEWSKIE